MTPNEYDLSKKISWSERLKNALPELPPVKAFASRIFHSQKHITTSLASFESIDFESLSPEESFRTVNKLVKKFSSYLQQPITQPKLAELAALCSILYIRSQSVAFDNWQKCFKNALILEKKARLGLSKNIEKWPNEIRYSLRRRLLNIQLFCAELFFENKEHQESLDFIMLSLSSGVMNNEDWERIMSIILVSHFHKETVFNICLQFFAANVDSNSSLAKRVNYFLRTEMSTMPAASKIEREKAVISLRRLQIITPWLEWPVILLVEQDMQEGRLSNADNKLSTIFPFLQDAGSKTRASFLLGQIEFAKGNYKDSQEYFDVAINGVADLTNAFEADALLIAARAAEWANDWGRMETLILTVLKAVPDNLTFQYWLIRARLHRPMVQPLEGISESLLGRLPNGQRLLLQVQLHQHPTFDSVEKILSVLDEQHNAFDPQELTLTVWLVEQALTSQESRRIENLRKCADLSNAVAKFVSTLPWVEVNCALVEVQLDHQYLNALKRLQMEGVHATPTAMQLLQVVRLLVGLPLSSEILSDETCLGVLKESLQRLLEKSSAQDDAALLVRLEELEQHSLVSQYPALKISVDLLSLALRATVVGETVQEALLAYSIPPNAPSWASWLLVRLMVLGGVPFGNLPALDLDSATFIDMWWQHFGRPGQVVPDAVERARALIQNESEKQSLLTSGSFVERTRKIEAQLQQVLSDSRVSLAEGRAAAALSELRAVETLLEEHGPLTSSVWRPLLRYWIAVASMHAGLGNAALLLEAQSSGVMGAQVRAQLALLALQNHDGAAARRWLTDLTPDFPAALYAQALQHARNNQPAETVYYLDELDSKFGEVPSPYVVAGRRLRAALAERNSEAAAENLLKAILQEWPADAITRARLDRILLKRAYEVDAAKGLPIAEPQLGGKATSDPIRHSAFTWDQQYQLFYRILTYSKVQSTDALTPLVQEIDLQIADPNMRVWWRELMATKLLQSGDAANALMMLDFPSVSKIPPDVERLRIMLSIWAVLTCRTTWEPSPEAASRLEEQVYALQSLGTEDSTVNLWCMLAQNAALLFAGVGVAPEQWRALDNSPMSHIPFLFDENQDIRRAAAVALIPLLNENPSFLSEKAQELLNAITAWTMQSDDAFLEHYNHLEPVLDTLPLSGSDLWVTAALTRFSRKDWGSLVGASLPNSIADMSEPLVCLIVELADAQAAIADMNNPNQKLVRRINGIYNNLAALIERLDSQRATT